MTIPGGAPNLPTGSLTVDTLAERIQDTSNAAMKARAVERFPSTFDNSTGLSAASDFTPFGILTSIFAGVNSVIARADPADIQGPDDLPGLFLDFIEGLPVIGQFVGLLEAIIGTYNGDDQVLLTVQEIFAPIRALLQLFTSGITDAIPTVDEITAGVNKFLQAFAGLDLTNPGSIATAIQAVLQQIIDAIVGAITGTATQFNDITAIVGSLFNPMQLIQNALGMIEALANQLGGKSGGLDARLSALEAAALGASGLVSADNFNRALIGSTWTNVTGTLVISDGDYVKTGALAAAYYNASKSSTNKYGVAVRLAARSPGDCAFYAFSDTTMSNYVGVRVHAGIFGDDGLSLFTGSSPSVGVAQRWVPFVSNFLGHNSLNDGDVIALNYDDVTNTYTVSRNNNVIDGLTWTDTTNIITHGSTKRENGIVTCLLNQNQFPGFGVTDFVYYDRIA